MKRTTTIILLLPLLFSVNLANAEERAGLTGSLSCTPMSVSGSTWGLELDERIPLAIVDDEDKPADYSPSHVRIQMAPEGLTMTIGRSTGQYLANSDNGEVLGYGTCQARITA